MTHSEKMAGTDKKSVRFGDEVSGSTEKPKPTNADGLAVQDLESLDVTQLTPITPEVISRQATINIGTIGHVAHGKSTVVKAISGVQTVRFKTELERNITIKLGYANAKIFCAEDPTVPRPDRYAVRSHCETH